MRMTAEDAFLGLGWGQRLWKPVIQRLLTGRWAPLVMRPAEVTLPTDLERLGLYLHVPFCRRPCPYCPYNRVRYDESLYRRFEAAAHQEIELYARQLAAPARPTSSGRPRVASLYVGGGTPTVVPEGLVRLIAHIQHAFGRAGDVCVELHPSAMDDNCLAMLKSVGVNMVSIGVETLSERLLSLIGRSHDAATAEDAVRRALACGFDCVNTDLMFAMPTQTLEDLEYDLGRVLALDVDQVSAYPMFGFPYTESGKRLGLRGIRRPSAALIRGMLALVRRRAEAHGLRQCAVWSFVRPARKRFSSVTRHYYLGFGPGAASMTGRQFYLNTFFVEEYAAALPDRLPVALALPVSRRLEMAYWLYWRAYEMSIPSAGFRELFGDELDRVYGWLLRPLGRLGAIHRENGCYRVSADAAYWIHRLQNEFALDYIDHVWGRCRAEARPRQVRL